MSAPRDPSNPQPGFFKVKMIRGGPWCGAEIRKFPVKCNHEPGVVRYWWCACIDGDVGEHVLDPSENREIMRVWNFGRTISEAEYLILTRHGRNVDPCQKINLAAKDSIF
jgi:hypothetical protein